MSAASLSVAVVASPPVATSAAGAKGCCAALLAHARQWAALEIAGFVMYYQNIQLALSRVGS